MCPAYLTHNINLGYDLANGTFIIEHYLLFDSVQEKIFLEDMIKTTPTEGTFDLPTPSTAINIKLYPDFYVND